MFPEIQQPVTCSTILICTYKVNLPRLKDFPEWLIKANKYQSSPYEVQSVKIFMYKKDVKT